MSLMLKKKSRAGGKHAAGRAPGSRRSETEISLNQIIAVETGRENEARRIMRRRADRAAVICRALLILALAEVAASARGRVRAKRRTRRARVLSRSLETEICVLRVASQH